MLTPAQLKLRRTMVTATNAVVICGFSPSKKRTLLTEYLEKTDGVDANAEAFEYDDYDGEIEPFAVSVGHHNEPLGVATVGREYGVLVAPGDTIRHPSEAWIGATPDAFIVERPAKPILARHMRRTLAK